jgi:GMP synthase (glutamine-hydrolysing)
MIIVVDNTKNLKKAFMTPKLLKCLDATGMEYVVVSNCEQTSDALRNIEQVEGAILSGGPMSLAQEVDMQNINKNILVLLSLDKPILGICFGLQIIGACYGGQVIPMEEEKQGNVEIVLTENYSSILFQGLDDHNVTRYHQDCLEVVPEHFVVTARTSDGVVQAIECPKIKRWGVQFHPEAKESSQKIIRNFVNMIIKSRQK